jgi:hypothetical protein
LVDSITMLFLDFTIKCEFMIFFRFLNVYNFLNFSKSFKKGIIITNSKERYSLMSINIEPSNSQHENEKVSKRKLTITMVN